jgi:hypothetical protein
VILDKKLNWKVVCIAYWQYRGKTFGIITEGGGLAIHFRGEAHFFICFAGMVEESGAEKCSETAFSLEADGVFGNY